MKIVVRILLGLIIAAVPLSSAEAQRRTALRTVNTLAHEPVWPAETRTAIWLPTVAPDARIRGDQRLTGDAPEERQWLDAGRVSPGRGMAVGAAVGVALGVAATFLQPGCSSTQRPEWNTNMCPVALIGFTLNGAWMGAGVGYLVAEHR